MASNIFEKLGSTYSEIDGVYVTKIFSARSRNFHIIEKKLEEKKKANDQAYFLYMFTRFEDRISDLSTKLINEKISTLTDWKYKRVWEILKKKKSLDFLEKVALLTKISGSDYNLIQKYYKQRNNIAHGKNFTIPILMPTAINDLKRLYDDLKP